MREYNIDNLDIQCVKNEHMMNFEDSDQYFYEVEVPIVIYKEAGEIPRGIDSYINLGQFISAVYYKVAEEHKSYSSNSAYMFIDRNPHPIPG